MPAASDIPLRRCQINLFAEDVECLEARYGRGWTEQVRILVKKNCDEYRKFKLLLQGDE